MTSEFRVTLLNTYDTGGAAEATKRIHRGLRRLGVDSRLLVQIQQSDEPTVVGPESTTRTVYGMARVLVDAIPTKLHGGTDEDFSVNWLPDDITRQIDRTNPDIVHLNWIGEGYFRVKSIASISQPIVWTLQDMWAFTGGCHYSGDCRRYERRCGKCPKLDSKRQYDVSRWTWRRKFRAWEDIEIAVVATSSWMADVAGQSSLFNDNRIEVIPNGVDTSVFRPIDETFARELFGFDQSDTLILFGADAPDDRRKGLDLLVESLEFLAGEDAIGDFQAVVFGKNEPEGGDDYEFETSYVGYLHDKITMAALYSAADTFVVPSRYDACPQTVIESLACGTPVVAFDTSGQRDLIDHREDGYLADPYDPRNLATGIEQVVEHSAELGKQGREKTVENYDIEVIANQYLNLYSDLL